MSRIVARKVAAVWPDEAMAAGLDGSDRIVVSTKMLRSELLSVKADVESELAKVILDAPSAGSASTTSAASVCGPDIGRTRSVTARDAEAHALTLANRPGGGWAN